MVNKYELLNRLARITPASVRGFAKRFIAVPGTEFDEYRLSQRNPYRDADPVYRVEGSPVTLGIIQERQHYHHSYIGACRDLGISYKLLDIFRSDWISVIEQSGCDAFLVWPSVGTTVWKQMFDDRLRCMEEDLGKIIYPTGKETWLYENKRRAHNWFEAHKIPHPRTWVFYDRKEALEFAEHTELPIIFKASHGGTASGVRILRTRSQAKRLVRKMFAGGMIPRGYHPQDRQRGSIYFQEYLPNVKEWRMARIGDSYFGYRKEKDAGADFHSGSHAWSWLDPPRPLLNMLSAAAWLPLEARRRRASSTRGTGPSPARARSPSRSRTPTS